MGRTGASILALALLATGSAHGLERRAAVPRPKVGFATFLGGSNVDTIEDVAVDGSGDVYVVGSTISPDLPTKAAADGSYFDSTCDFEDPCFDGFAAKLSGDGRKLVYLTYLGGSRDDRATGVAVDDSGAAYVTGVTGSVDYPVTPGAAQGAYAGGDGDAFVTKLDPSGALAYSTFLGGSATWEDMPYGIDVDPAGNAVVVGRTPSANFPTTPGAFQPACDEDRHSSTSCGSIYDAFVTKLNPGGTGFVYSTYLGGADFHETAHAVAVDRDGAAYVTGETYSDDFPVTEGSYDPKPYELFKDVFVTKVDPSGARLVYSTFLGGDYEETGLGIDVDTEGAAYVVGRTLSPDFPTTKGSFDPWCSPGGRKPRDLCTEQTDGFVAKLSPSGAELRWSAYLGGERHNYYEEARDVAVARDGAVWIVGGTASDDFPLLREQQWETRTRQCDSMDCYDAFVTRVDPSGRSLDMSTVYGGESNDVANGIAANGRSVLVAGTTNSPGFPTADALYPKMQTPKGCKERHPYYVVYRCSDGFVLKVRDEGDPVAHRRRLTLSVRGHLVARGRVIVSTGYARCARRVPVEVFEYDGSRWRRVGRGRTDAEGRYRMRIRHMEGGFVARSRDVDAKGRNVCQHVVSGWDAHSHDAS